MKEELELNKFAWLVLFFSKNGVTKTALNKLIFFTDYCYYAKTGNTIITNDTYIKLQYGPVPKSIEEVKNVCIYSGYLQSEIKKYYTQLGTYYTLKKPFEEFKFRKDIINEEEKEIAELVYKKLAGETSSYLSTFSHLIEPWKSSEYGDKLSPEKMKKDEIYKKYKVENLYELLESDKYKEIPELEKFYIPL